MIRLSIILPCYNVEKYIAECLDSLYAQDILETEYEVICVNDCSPDGTRDIIVDYQKKHPNLVLIDHEVNKRQAVARNTGIKAAKGEYVWFVDPDDFVRLNCFKRTINTLEEDKLDILQFNIEINEKSKIIDFDSSNLCEETQIQSGIDYLKMIMEIHWGRVVEVCRRIYNRNFLINNEIYFPETFNIGEDAVFFYRAILKCKTHKQITDYLYTYRVDNLSSTINTANMSGTRLAERFMSSIEIIKLFHYSDIEPIDFRNKCIETYIWAIKKYRKKIIKLNYTEQQKFYKKITTFDFSILKKYSTFLENTLYVNPKFSQLILIIISPILRGVYSLIKIIK